ncbi:unnamed protein product [Peronospora belbahrii]|uniref:tRNA-guanine(15) transglycosylase-like domain-containing protein n=1 Tax=Peronospora belbahrii TaxID=622444 RepID=A0ABN8CWV1_9STRA|nr:unnamed protein product [Peronospora belbahrii]
MESKQCNGMSKFDEVLKQRLSIDPLLFASKYRGQCTSLDSREYAMVDNCLKIKDLTAQVVDFADILSLVKLAMNGIRSFRELLNVIDYRLVFSARDYVNNSNPPSFKATAFMVETSGGRRVISTEEFMQAAQLLQLELIVPLADEISGTQFFAFAVVVGGNDQILRQVSATETCKRDIQVVLLSGLSFCNDRAKRLELIDIIVKAVTLVSLPRLISGIGHPLDVLDTFNRGVDAFVSPYPDNATKAGSVLVFWISDDDNGSSARERFGGLLHLREKRFATDFSPLMAGFDCFTCQKYSRAYVHHMLNVREMLGAILLYLHNLQHYYRFFREIRAVIIADRFSAYHAKFASKFKEKVSPAPPLLIPAAIEERTRKTDVKMGVTKATAPFVSMRQ